MAKAEQNLKIMLIKILHFLKLQSQSFIYLKNVIKIRNKLI